MLLSAAEGYIDEAAEALAATKVYVSREVGDAAELTSSLTAEVGDASIGVAVLSDNAALESSSADIVAELAAQTGYDTIIVAVGDDLAAGSHVLARGEAMRLANEAEQSAGSVDAALVETVQGVLAATPADAAGGGASAGDVVAWGVIGLIALGAAAAAAGIAIGVRRSRRGGSARHRPLPDPIRPHVATLRGLGPAYAAAGTAGNRVAGEVAGDIQTVAGHATELFDRLDRKGDEGQRSVAAVEYGETLRKLTAALDRDYLLDILQRPDLWDDPDDRVREVRDAVASVSAQLVENIKQVNARRGLHFQVSLDGLISGRRELREWERAFDQAGREDAGPETPPRGA